MQFTDAMKQFAARHALKGLTERTLKHLYEGTFSIDKAHHFIDFYGRIEKDLLNHPVMTDNIYTKWFAATQLNDLEVRHFIVQLSVFSNQLLVAQLQKMVNADCLEDMRAAKEQLAADIGVTVQSDPEPVKFDSQITRLGGYTNSIEGSRFHYSEAPFELLLQLGKKLGLSFGELGHRRHGTPSTLFFCDELIRLYGSFNPVEAESACFAVKSWSAGGVWSELVQGLRNYSNRKKMALPLQYFTLHESVEKRRARAIKTDLEHYYFSRQINENDFIEGAWEMLDRIQMFWNGLDGDRKRIH